MDNFCYWMKGASEALPGIGLYDPWWKWLGNGFLGHRVLLGRV